MDIEATKQDLIKKWIFNTPFKPLPEVVESAMDEYASLHPKIKELAQRNYNAQLKRGTITDETKLHDFLMKLQEEFNEVMDADSLKDISEELIDVIMVAVSTLIRLKLEGAITKDWTELFEDKTIYNENRND